MPELAYREVYAVNRVEARRYLIQTYERTGDYSETARQWYTSRHVVRRWARRYREPRETERRDQSRRPHHSQRQTRPEVGRERKRPA